MRAVLFDMDGVLVLSNPVHFRSWVEFGRALGVVITEEMFYREFSGRKNEEALEALFPGRFSEREKADLSRRKEAYYREQLGHLLEPVPGVQELVRNLHERGVPLALATSGPPENVDYVLRRLGLEDAFQARITGDEVPKAKPDPAIFLEAAARLRVPPAEALVIEDSLAGVLAAVAAGCPCLGVTTTEPEERLLAAGAARAVPDFRGLTVEDLLGVYRRARAGAAKGRHPEPR